MQELSPPALTYTFMNLQELEARLQALIEVDFLKLLPGKKLEDIIIQKLAAAIQHNILTLADGSGCAPDTYRLCLHPGAALQWDAHILKEVLLHSITMVTREAGLQLRMAPTIQIVLDEAIASGDAQVSAFHQEESISKTTSLPGTEDTLNAPKCVNPNAFLIVEGVRVFALNQPVINIGRRLENQLVLDDPRVSRNHAQLRTLKEKFVVFDLNSSGGTFINGQRISQAVLLPGDVLSLAGVQLIFGQDNPLPLPETNETKPMQSAENGANSAAPKTSGKA